MDSTDIVSLLRQPCVEHDESTLATKNNASSGREQRIVAVVILLLTIQTGLLGYSAYIHSPVVDEPGHLVAGISHWMFGRFQLYRVNPPLVRMVAALPVLACEPKTEWTRVDRGPRARLEFGLGQQFVTANRDRAFWYFTIARWACIPFAWIGGIVGFLWARSLYGPRAGILTLTLWCFSPTILAHGALITSDVAATSLGLAACYCFWTWLRTTTWKRSIAAGLVLGLAELTKTTLVIFFPIWIMFWLGYRWSDRATMPMREWRRQGAMLATQLVLSLYLINLGYVFEGSFTRLGDFTFVSNNLRGSEPGQYDNRFANTLLGNLPIPLPAEYILGIDVQRRDFETYKNPSFLRGKFQDRGWWYYYLYAMAIKVPLGAWGLLAMTCLWRLKLSRNYHHSPCREPQDRKASIPPRRDEAILFVVPLVIVTLVSSQTGFNEHMRYVLPAFPFAFIWVGQLANLAHVSRRLPFLAGVLLVWSVGHSLWVFPHSLSYFNELVGGPTQGHNHLLHSNCDWGQDLILLRDWNNARTDNKPLYLAYFGYVDPSQLGIEFTAPQAVNEATSTRLKPGWYAISANLLHGFPWFIPDGSGRQLISQKSLIPFLSMKPVARAGYSIYIYEVMQTDGP